MIFAGKSSQEIEHYTTTRVNFIIIVAIVSYILCMIIATVVTGVVDNAING